MIAALSAALLAALVTVIALAVLLVQARQDLAAARVDLDALAVGPTTLADHAAAILLPDSPQLRIVDRWGPTLADIQGLPETPEPGVSR